MFISIYQKKNKIIEIQIIEIFLVLPTIDLNNGRIKKI